MAKKAAASHMNPAEQLAGTILFVVYLLVLPLLTERLFSLWEVLFNTRLDQGLRGAVFYDALAAVTLLVFHRTLAADAGRFFDDVGRSGSSLLLGLLVFYGANALTCRGAKLLDYPPLDLSGTVVAARAGGIFPASVLAGVLLAPFVEEALFRGLVFGSLRDRSRAVAYLASALLFAFFYAWTSASAPLAAANLARLVQYMAPGLVFAWTYDRSGSLWAPILVRAAINALALWT